MKRRKIWWIIVITAIILAIVLIFVFTGSDDFHKKYAGFDFESQSSEVDRQNTYEKYLTHHSNSVFPTSNVNVNVTDFVTELSNGVRQEEGYLFTEEESSVTWKVTIPTAGFYNIRIKYKTVPSRGVDMERVIKINGEVPFSGADRLVFPRMWTDANPIEKDNRGNAIRPTQKEIFDWQTITCKDDLGYETEPYKFWFNKGESNLTLVSNNEPVIIGAIEIATVSVRDTYASYLSKQPPINGSKSDPIIIQGESSQVRSSPSLFAKYDRASATTQPYDVMHTVFNYIGGDPWKSAGQWIEWDFDVPEDGYYTITIKGRQSYQRGFISCRSLNIDGEIPFKECETIGFPYSNDWRLITLSTEAGEPCHFYLSKGSHKMKLEVTLGRMGELINRLEESVFRLNSVYRTILVLTGALPDQFRDYAIDKVYPEAMEAMNVESKRLYKLVDDYKAYTGQKSDKIASALNLAIQLEEFYKAPHRITKGFTNFKDNITSLGGSMQQLSETKLDVDYIAVNSVDNKPQKDNAGFFRNFGHQVGSFIASFFVDYSSLGNVYKKSDKDVIQVWLVTGRDQSTVLKNIVDDSFTPKSGVKVNIKLIDQNALLSAVVAGNGPDVVLSIYASAPVDYALRNASENLAQFDDLPSVLKQFNPSAYRAYQYNGGCYALPETETFSLLFYRKDILDQLDLEVPTTWNDLIAILPTLQGNNLSVGMPYTSIQTPNLSVFYSMMYQNGGHIYNDNGTRTKVDDEAGIKAFKMYTSFYNNYGLPIEYDFLSRFRSGEMPIGINDYTTYNTLAVAAPEIRDLWGFAPLPGTIKKDAEGNTYIDRSTNAGGVACMMIKTDDERIRNNSWEFMKWWVSTNTQVRFGREMEALLGTSARYATANVDALRQLSWSTKQIAVLNDALSQSVGVPETPGSYFTSRHITNAIRSVINKKEDPRETLIDYARKINEELTKKREEFGLPTE